MNIAGTLNIISSSVKMFRRIQRSTLTVDLTVEPGKYATSSIVSRFQWHCTYIV